jgi:SAM-dependent methyltransferase
MYKDKNIKDILLSETYKGLLEQYMTMFDMLVDNIPELKNKCNHFIDDGKSFGYYISRSVPDLYLLLRELKVKKFLDLGCGMGIILKMLWVLSGFDEENKGYLEVRGIEIDELLVKYSLRVCGNGHFVRQGDILSLSKDDIKDADVIYMWEPFRSDEYIKKIHDDLYKLMEPNQRIIFNSSGRVGSYFEHSECFKSYWHRTVSPLRSQFLVCRKED